MKEVDLDALGLLTTRRQISVRFGPVELGPALKKVNISSQMNEMPDAKLVVDVRDAPNPPDYFAGLAVATQEHGHSVPRFTGSVVDASPEGSAITVNALGAVSLAETLVGGLATWGIPHFELVYVLARSGGLRDEQLNIEGLETLPRESFEVIAPLDGIEVSETANFGGVRFLPHQIGMRALAALGVVPKDVVHPGLLGGWGCRNHQLQRRTPDEPAR